MIPDRLLMVTVDWVHPAAGTDGYGNTIDDWDAATTTSLAVKIDQLRTSEELGNRDATLNRLVLFTNELAVSAIDRFVWDGWVYEVDGEPSIVYTPAGPHHAEIRIRRVEG